MDRVHIDPRIREKEFGNFQSPGLTAALRVEEKIVGAATTAGHLVRPRLGVSLTAEQRAAGLCLIMRRTIFLPAAERRVACRCV